MHKKQALHITPIKGDQSLLNRNKRMTKKKTFQFQKLQLTSG